MIYKYIQVTASERAILLPPHGSKKFTKQTICNLCARNPYHWSWYVRSLRYVVTCVSQTFLTQKRKTTHPNIYSVVQQYVFYMILWKHF